VVIPAHRGQLCRLPPTARKINAQGTDVWIPASASELRLPASLTELELPRLCLLPANVDSDVA
jgi:hypothetical protein